jgi:hypothetical protein
MNAALAIVAAVALILAVALVVSRRTGRAAVAGERSRAEDLSSQLEAQRQAAAEMERRAAEAEEHAAEAERHAAEADRAAAAEREQHAGAADRAAAEAEHAAAAVGREAAPAGDGANAGAGAGRQADGGVDEAFWELERLRLEREWRDVAGPAAPLPSAWDGTVAAALAVELEIVREVVGTPSTLDASRGSDAGPGSSSKSPESPGSPVSPESPQSPRSPEVAEPATAVRLGSELLRELARSGDELFVYVSHDSQGLAINVRSVASDKGPTDAALQRLSSVARAAGGRLEWSPAADGVQAQLWLPGK